MLLRLLVASSALSRVIVARRQSLLAGANKGDREDQGGNKAYR